MKTGDVVEITVDDNGRLTDYPGNEDLKKLVDEPQQLVYIGKVMEQNEKFVLLRSCYGGKDDVGNNDFFKVLKAGITKVIYFKEDRTEE